MLIQLALGVMSVPLMALVAFVILLEKQWRHGEMLARVVGAASLAGGIVSGPSRYNPAHEHDTVAHRCRRNRNL